MGFIDDLGHAMIGCGVAATTCPDCDFTMPGSEFILGGGPDIQELMSQRLNGHQD